MCLVNRCGLLTFSLLPTFLPSSESIKQASFPAPCCSEPSAHSHLTADAGVLTAVSMLVSCGYRDTSSQTQWWLETTEVDSLTGLEPRGPRSRYWQDHSLHRVNLSRPLPSPGGCWHSWLQLHLSPHLHIAFSSVWVLSDSVSLPVLFLILKKIFFGHA